MRVTVSRRLFPLRRRRSPEADLHIGQWYLPLMPRRVESSMRRKPALQLGTDGVSFYMTFLLAHSARWRHKGSGVVPHLDGSHLGKYRVRRIRLAGLSTSPEPSRQAVVPHSHPAGACGRRGLLSEPSSGDTQPSKIKEKKMVMGDRNLSPREAIRQVIAGLGPRHGRPADYL